MLILRVIIGLFFANPAYADLPFMFPDARGSEEKFLKYNLAGLEQRLIVGSQSFLSLLVKEGVPTILEGLRGPTKTAKFYWALGYKENGVGKSILSPALNENSDDLEMWYSPSSLKMFRKDDSLQVVQTLTPCGWKVFEKIEVTNLSDEEIDITFFHIRDFYFEPIVKPTVFELFINSHGLMDQVRYWSRLGLRQEVKTTRSIDPRQTTLHVDRWYPQPCCFPIPSPSAHTERDWYPSDAKAHFFGETLAPYNAGAALPYPGTDRYNLFEIPVQMLPAGDAQTQTLWVVPRKASIKPGSVMTFVSWVEIVPKGLNKVPFPVMENLQALDPFSSAVPKDNDMRNVFEFGKREAFYSADAIKAMAMLDAQTGRVFASQGGNYTYGFGLVTAFRDLLHGALGITRIYPDLAKSTLEYLMSMQSGKSFWTMVGLQPIWIDEGYLPYSWNGAGYINYTDGVRSDFDLEMIWGLVDYLEHGPNEAHSWFFGEKIAFYPADKLGNSPAPKKADSSFTPYAHARVAFYHLKNVIGVGEHRLVKSRDGDWSDALNTLAGPMGSVGFAQAASRGESPMVSAMAVVVLKQFISYLRRIPQGVAPQNLDEFMNDLEDYVAGMQDALHDVFHQCKNGFFPRLIVGDSFYLDDYIDTAANVWAILDTDGKTILNAGERQDILNMILEKNASGTQIGIRTVTIPDHIKKKQQYFILQGSKHWAFVGTMAAVAAVRNRHEQGWEILRRTSLTNYNRIYKRGEFNPFASGPDGRGSYGGSWTHPNLPGMANEGENNVNQFGLWNWAFFEACQTSELLKR